MGSLVIETPPSVEPVALADAKNFCRVIISNDDSLISSFITAAREMCEAFTGRSFVQKGYRQSLDAFPYFADSMFSQLAMPPSYYSMPMYATTLWNYSQQIKLFAPPLVSVDSIKYFDPNGNQQTLDPSQYIVDSDSEPARVFPGPGLYWPAVQYRASALQIHFTAGFSNDASKVPQAVKVAIMQLVAGWYEQREAIQPGNFSELPNHVKALLWTWRILDYAPTRG